MSTETTQVDESRVMHFVGKVLDDLGAANSTVLALIGDRLGLYRAMADGGPCTPAELANRTGTAERYVREWLFNQAAGGYVEYDPASQRFTLPPEHAMVLADESSPVYAAGGFQVASDLFAVEPRIRDAFCSGAGVAWHEHTQDLFAGVERFFRPSYAAYIATGWIPSLEGVDERLRAGARVADIGCGHGASTVIMATAYPSSTFAGFDYHAASIERARELAGAQGVSARVAFEVAAATTYPGTGYDLVCFFDCLHDMGDPVATCRHALETLAPNGVVMIVEPFANDRLEDNLNPVGRVYSAASALVCVPSSLAQDGAAALGAQAGEARMRAVLSEAGFAHFRRTTQTPFHIVYEARA